MQNEPNANRRKMDLRNGPKNSVVTQQLSCNENSASEKSKIERKNKCDLGPDFVAPDGGWGWLIVVAAGVSNMCCFPVFQQFGLLFADRMKSIELSASQITTIINLNACLKSCIGLANGPMFRKFTYRQVGLFGALLIALSILLMTFSNSFITYLLTFSVLYGISSGINANANSLALNTYFKEKRRIATGLSWTITGMGPVIMPQIIAIILPLYGLEGSLLLYVGLALIAAMCSSLYHPVQWHVKKPDKLVGDNPASNDIAIECDYCALTERREQQNFILSQYLHNDDDLNVTSAQNSDDSNRTSSNNLSLSAKERDSPNVSETKIGELSQDVSSAQSHETSKDPSIAITFRNAIEQMPSIAEQQLSVDSTIPTRILVDDASTKNKELVKNGDRVLTDMNIMDACTCKKRHPANETADDIAREETKRYTLWQKIVKFFDLDLLLDFTYLNLMVGVTLGEFVELNFSLLTPFVLAEWNFTKPEIATILSILGGVDISVRFFVPFIAEKIGWDNKTFFLMGIMGMALGRVFITIFRSYWCILGAFCWIGLGKGLRTVFMALVIPSYVPLNRLPAALGLQLSFAGVFFFIAGPVVGHIRDRTSYVVTLHCLSGITYFVVACWLLEKFYRDYEQRKSRSSMRTKAGERMKQFLTAIVSPPS